MTRPQRTAMVMVIALIAASLSSYGVYRALAHQATGRVGAPTTAVVVAARALPVGRRLAAEDVRVVQWPAHLPVEHAFARVSDVVDRGLLTAVEANEPIVPSRLAAQGAGAGLPPTIPAGMRAVAVKVDEVIGVAGFVLPGTRVDVLATTRDARGEERTTHLVAGNIQVLAAGTRYEQERAQTETKPLPSTVVTLLVTPADAQRVALAQAEGELKLALRNPLDGDVSDVAQISSGALFGGPPAAVQAPARTPSVAARAVVAAAPVDPPEVTPPPPPPPPYTVQMIRAATSTDVIVRE